MIFRARTLAAGLILGTACADDGTGASNQTDSEGLTSTGGMTTDDPPQTTGADPGSSGGPATGDSTEGDGSTSADADSGSNTSGSDTSDSDSSDSTGTSEATAPEVTVLFPPPSSQVDGLQVLVAGRSFDESEITEVRVAGVLADSDDGFATWRAVVPLTTGPNTLGVEATDNWGNTNADAAVEVLSQPPLFSPTHGAIDSAGGRFIVADRSLDQVVAIDLTTGYRSVISAPGVPNDDVPFSQPYDLALDVANDRAFVIDFPGPLVAEIDLSTGQRTVVSSDSVGTGPTLYLALTVEFDAGRLFVLQGSNASGLFDIDLVTGDRTLLSGRLSQGSPWVPDAIDPFPTIVQGAAALPDASTVVVGGYNPSQITLVDTTTGVRTLLSDDATPDATNPLGTVIVLAHDAANNRVFAGNTAGDIIEVSTQTGARTYLPDPGDVDPLLASNAGTMTYDATVDRLLVSDNYQMIAIDVATGGRTRQSSHYFPHADNQPNGDGNLALDPDHDRVLYAGYDHVYGIDLQTGLRSVVSGPSVPDNNNPLQSVSLLTVDVEGGRAFGVETDAQELIAVDLDTGARTIVSDALSAGPMWTQPIEAVWDPQAATVYVSDGGSDTIFAVDPTTGTRAVLSGPAVPDSDNPLQYIARFTLDTDNARLLVVNQSPSAVYAVDLATGIRTVLSDADNPDSDNQLGYSAWSISVDPAAGVAWVSGEEGLVAIDLATGAREPAIDFESYVSTAVLDGGRLLVASDGAVMQLDAVSGSVAYLSRWND